MNDRTICNGPGEGASASQKITEPDRPKDYLPANTAYM